MKKILFLILSMAITICFSQTKEELIIAMIKANRIEYDCVGMGCTEGENYKRFKKLKKLITGEEFLALAEHKNPIIRMYFVDELLSSKTKEISKVLLSELKKNESVLAFSGCVGRMQSTVELLYNDYHGKVYFNCLKGKDVYGKTRDSIQKEALATHKTLKALDHILLHTDQKVSYLVYARLFENRKYKDFYLPKIEELAFQRNNSVAFEYLQKFYPSTYTEKFANYMVNNFPKAVFESEDEIYHLEGFVDFVLKTENDLYEKILVSKLRNNTSWKKYPWRIKHLLKKYNIKL